MSGSGNCPQPRPELGTLIRKLRFRCRAMGTRELAVLMSGFFDTEGARLEAAELQVLLRLLERYSDPDLLDFLSGNRPWPAWADSVTARLESYVGTQRPAR